MQNINFNIEVFEENGQFTAVTRDLNVSSCGDTPDGAEKSLREAISLFLEECERMGTLQEILEEAGYSLENGSFQPAKPIISKKLSLAV